MLRARVVEANAPPRVDICYVTPCKRRLRTFPEIQRYIDANNINDLTIDNFSFSKKVNVGVIIDERSLMDHQNDPLVHPKRGRPPKHLKALRNNAKETKKEINGEGEGTRVVSLEPHEIKAVPQAPSTTVPSAINQTSVTTTTSGVGSGVYEPHSITCIVNNTHTDSTKNDSPQKNHAQQNTFNHSGGSQDHTLHNHQALQDRLPPPLVTTISSHSAMPPPQPLLNKRKRKRKPVPISNVSATIPPPTFTQPPPTGGIVKKPRGRPRGSKSSSEPTHSVHTYIMYYIHVACYIL